MVNLLKQSSTKQINDAYAHGYTMEDLKVYGDWRNDLPEHIREYYAVDCDHCETKHVCICPCKNQCSIKRKPCNRIILYDGDSSSEVDLSINESDN